jgi:hypothetical protein
VSAQASGVHRYDWKATLLLSLLSEHPKLQSAATPKSSVEVQIIELKAQEVTQTSLLGSSTDSTNSSVSLKTACKQKIQTIDSMSSWSIKIIVPI